jgi:serine/threonine protein kinase
MHSAFDIRTAAALLLTLIYAILQVGFVRPCLPADVFALGVIAYEMLTGDLPFSRGSLTDVILAQARGARPLGERDTALPAAVERAVMRALSMVPEERPASPQTFAAELSGV